MVAMTDTAIGWTVVGLAAAGAAYYYSQSGRAKKGRGRIQAAAIEQSQRRESDIKTQPRDKRKKKATGKGKNSDQSDQPDQAITDVVESSSTSVQASPSERVKKRKAGKQQQPPSKLAQSLAAEGNKAREVESHKEKEEDEGMSNADFAKQLLEKKTGTSLKKPTTANETVRTRKQGKRNEELPSQATNGTITNGAVTRPNGVAGAQDMSTASSTTGADADDDLSLPMSPEFGATTESGAPSGADISDMLEAPKKGPSVLRLTEPSNPPAFRTPKPQKAAPAPETKKQRQNRQKNEMKKAAREEAEKARLAALEKQKRDVRIAEGRPMQNGVNTTKPQDDPWRAPRSLGILPPVPKIPEGTTLPPFPEDYQPADSPLLDTFDESATTVKHDPKTTEEKKTWERELPSEEEQIRRISELDSDNAWSTVTKGGKGKKKAAAAEQKIKNGEISRRSHSTSNQISSNAKPSADNKYVFDSNDADTSPDTNDTSLDADDDDIMDSAYATHPPTSNGNKY
ncbi:hypothetical protein P7C71_g3014, partial [Lecanoromycetidae sp. Uapishka_2]